MKQKKPTVGKSSKAKDNTAPSPRHDWDAQFTNMAKNGDDILSEVAAAPSLSEWDAKEWEWENGKVVRQNSDEQ